MTRSELVVFLARAFDFVREAQSIGQNRGQRVEAIQHWAGGITGESWCMDFATTVLDLAFKGKAPILRCLTPPRQQRALPHNRPG